MKKNRFIKNYARIFIDKYKAEESSIEALQDYSNLIKQSRTLSSFFKNPGFSLSEKEKVIRSIAQKARMSGQVADFILFLNKQKAIYHVDQVAKAAFILLQDRRQKAMTEVITAEQLDDNMAVQIRNILEQVIGPDIQIQTSVDASLLGGFVIKTGSLLYDTSIKGQLRILKESLMKVSV